MGVIADLLKEIPSAARYKAELEEFEAKYEKLKFEFSKLKEENAWLKGELERLGKKDNQLGALEKNVLILLADSGSQWLAEHVGPKFGVGTAKMEHVLTQLMNNGLLNVHLAATPRGGDRRYSLSDKGREFLVLNDLIK